MNVILFYSAAITPIIMTLTLFISILIILSMNSKYLLALILIIAIAIIFNNRNKNVITETTDIEWRVSKDGLITQTDKSVDTSDLNHVCSEDDDVNLSYKKYDLKIQTQLTSPKRRVGRRYKSFQDSYEARERLAARMAETGNPWYECLSPKKIP